MKSKSKSFFYARFFSQLPFSSTHVDGGEDDTVFEEAQVLFEKIMGSSIDIILSRVPGHPMRRCLQSLGTLR